jgi:hypothetical protein
MMRGKERFWVAERMLGGCRRILGGAAVHRCDLELKRERLQPLRYAEIWHTTQNNPENFRSAPKS